MVIEKAIFEYDNTSITLLPGKSAFKDQLFIEFLTENTDKDHKRIRLNIHPKQPIVIHKLQLVFSHPYHNDSRVFCNGYQSWTESREFGKNEKIEPLRPLTAKLFKPYGDYGFMDYPDLPGHLHSWSYTYITSKNDKTVFLGSLSEFTGFTVFKHQTGNHRLVLEKDCAGLHLDHSYPAIDIMFGKGDKDQLFDHYFQLLAIPKLKAEPAFGWTSWYQHYTNISEKIILDNLEGAAKSGLPFSIFQIDDGYMKRVGDWMDIKPDFPNGMGTIASKIKGKNMKAGIWVAPFICEKKSNVFRFKKHWLLKDENGNPVKAGFNPLWSGHFYALDFYNQEVQNHISSIFFTMLNQWGFDMVKLDFLYAVALRPPVHKTRGQVMHEAMQFLRKIVGNKLILGCGVPISAAFGTTDYCRIGADVHLRWEHKLLRWLKNRERVSTILALTNTFGRFPLNGKGFWNDPDVFILRKKKNNLTKNQQRMLLLANILCGDLIFTSDNPAEYDEDTLNELHELLKYRNREAVSVIREGDRYHVKFLLDGKEKEAVFILNEKAFLEIS